ncbi:MAG: pilin [Candidatus Nealsonbacteria bacterium]
MKNEKLKILFSITFLGSLLFAPLISLAAGIYQVSPYPGTYYGSMDICYEGLVPCGQGKPYWKNGTIVGGKCQGNKVDEGMPCQFCHFFVMFRGILDFILKLVIVIGVLMLTIGGFMFLFAGGSPKTLDLAKRILTSTVIGLAIIFGAWLIINTIFMAIGVAGWTGLREGWFSIECAIKLP